VVWAIFFQIQKQKILIQISKTIFYFKISLKHKQFFFSV
jgi:hypothetical protein